MLTLSSSTGNTWNPQYHESWPSVCAEVQMHKHLADQSKLTTLWALGLNQFWDSKPQPQCHQLSISVGIWTHGVMVARSLSLKQCWDFVLAGFRSIMGFKPITFWLTLSANLGKLHAGRLCISAAIQTQNLMATDYQSWDMNSQPIGCWFSNRTSELTPEHCPCHSRFLFNEEPRRALWEMKSLSWQCQAATDS